jgi:hypothetical protein
MDSSGLSISDIEWENIHNKAIFDALNEALDYARPFSLKGPPLPWSKSPSTYLASAKCAEKALKPIPKVL